MFQGFSTCSKEKIYELSVGCVREECTTTNKSKATKFSTVDRMARLRAAKECATPRRQTIPSKIPHIVSKRDSLPASPTPDEKFPFHCLQEPMLVFFEAWTLLIFLLMHHELTRLQNTLWPLVRMLGSSPMERHQHQLVALLVVAQSQRTSLQSMLWTKPMSLPVSVLVLVLLLQYQFRMAANALSM